MIFLAKLPGRDADLSSSIQLLMLALAEAWAIEFQRGKRPKRLYSGAIRYEPEPPDWPCEEWADPFVVAERGWGDCDDLVLYRLAEILADHGYDPRRNTREELPAWPVVYRSTDGSKRYHIAIRHADTREEEDPALKLSKTGKVE